MIDTLAVIEIAVALVGLAMRAPTWLCLLTLASAALTLAL